MLDWQIIELWHEPDGVTGNNDEPSLAHFLSKQEGLGYGSTPEDSAREKLA